MLYTTEITVKKEWEKIISSEKLIIYPFFQSWNFGEVQKKIGFSVERLAFRNEKNDFAAVLQYSIVKAKRGTYIHARHGPVFLEFNEKAFDYLLQELSRIAKAENASFVRMNPLLTKGTQESFFKTEGFRSAPIQKMDGEVCWVLDISLPENDLLKNMRKSHRYLIKKALQNTELKIITTKNPDDIKKFLSLYTHLSKRKNFVPHRGIKEEFDIFASDDQELLYLAEYQGRIIAGALIAFVGNSAIYRHSASDETFREIPAMYLLLWEAIKEAKKRNKAIFNFWGVTTPDDSKRHPWQGLSLFKKGFGGELKEFIHAQDLPLSPLYWKTFAIESISKILKGY